MSSQTDTIELSPGESTVPTAIAWLNAIATRRHWPPSLTFALTISLDEALTNIMLYAFRKTGCTNLDHRMNDGVTPCTICVSCEVLSTHIQLRIIDTGHPYDPTQTAIAPLPQSVERASIGGHGLRLMRHYLSRLHYERRDRKNHLTLIINVPPHAAPFPA